MPRPKPMPHSDPNRLLSPRQVAQAIGASESSLKRWCDSGDIEVERTGGGHRRIRRDAVMRFLRERGRTPKQPDLLGLPAGTSLDARASAQVLPQFVDALLAGDDERLIALCSGLYLAQRTMADIGDLFVGPAFQEIGDKWAAGSIHVYEEHLAVVTMRSAIHALRDFLALPSADAPRALTATMAGDPYLLPISLIELVLREQGWNVTVLGPNHPVESLTAALQSLAPRLMCINVSHVTDRGALEADAAALRRAARKTKTTLLFGGAQWGGDRECSDLSELSEFARDAWENGQK